MNGARAGFVKVANKKDTIKVDVINKGDCFTHYSKIQKILRVSAKCSKTGRALKPSEIQIGVFNNRVDVKMTAHLCNIQIDVEGE